MVFDNKGMKSQEEIEWEQWARRLSEEKYENDVAASEIELKERTDKAIKEGIKKAMMEIALELINEGDWTDEKISRITNLNVREVEKLRDEN